MTSVILVIPTSVCLTEVIRTIQASVYLPEATTTTTKKKELELKKSKSISFKVKKKKKEKNANKATKKVTSTKATLWKRRKKKKVEVITKTKLNHQRFHLEKKKNLKKTTKKKICFGILVETKCRHRHQITKLVVEEEVPEQEELIYH